MLLTFLLAATAHAQDDDNLGEVLHAVGQAYAEQYLAPLVDAFGADINAGLFHTAKVGRTGLLPGLDLYLGIKAFGAVIPVEMKTFSLTYQTQQSFRAPDGKDYLVDVTYDIDNAPTAFGETEPGVVTARIDETVSPGPDGIEGTGDDIVVTDQAELELLPGLVDTDIAPLAIPQATVGTLLGTDVTVRYLPALSVSNYGSVEYSGFGVRHSISQYLPLPIHLAVQAFWQRLLVDDLSDNQVLDARARAINVAASLPLKIITFYAGVQFESTNVEVAYTFDAEEPGVAPLDIVFSQDAANTMRTIGGVSLHLGPLLINADYSVGSLNTVSAGVGLSL